MSIHNSFCFMIEKFNNISVSFDFAVLEFHWAWKYPIESTRIELSFRFRDEKGTYRSVSCIHNTILYRNSFLFWSKLKMSLGVRFLKSMSPFISFLTCHISKPKSSQANRSIERILIAAVLSLYTLCVRVS